MLSNDVKVIHLIANPVGTTHVGFCRIMQGCVENMQPFSFLGAVFPSF
jgi:hypothetical protein